MPKFNFVQHTKQFYLSIQLIPKNTSAKQFQHSNILNKHDSSTCKLQQTFTTVETN